MKYSEEEKKAIENFKYWIQTNTERGVCTIPDYICINALNLIDKQQKEIERLYKDNYRLDRENQLKFERAVDTTDYIPKEAIREKIDDLQRYKGLVMYEKYNYDAIIRHLKELLGE